MQLSLIPGKNKFVPALLLHSATYPEKLLRTTKYRAVITKFLHKTQHLNILNKIANKYIVSVTKWSVSWDTANSSITDN